MGEMFLKKILDKEFEALTVDELKVIVADDTIFSISKKDKKIRSFCIIFSNFLRFIYSAS